MSPYSKATLSSVRQSDTEVYLNYISGILLHRQAACMLAVETTFQSWIALRRGGWESASSRTTAPLPFPRDLNIDGVDGAHGLNHNSLYHSRLVQSSTCKLDIHFWGRRVKNSVSRVKIKDNLQHEVHIFMR